MIHEYYKQHPEVPQHPGWVRVLWSCRSTQKYQQLFCSAFNRCEPFQAKEEAGLGIPFAYFSVRMAVNFTAYVKETDQSSHLMQQKLAGSHTIWELIRQSSHCTQVDDILRQTSRFCSTGNITQIYIFWPKVLKLIKVIKDSDFSLVSNKNLGEILPSCSWDPGPDYLGKIDLKLHYL